MNRIPTIIMYILSACIGLVLINETKLIKNNKHKVLLYVLMVLFTLLSLVFEYFGNTGMVNVFFIIYSLIVDFSHISYFIFAPIEEVDEYMLKYKNLYKGLFILDIICFWSDISQLINNFDINNLEIFLRRMSFFLIVPIYFLRKKLLRKTEE